MNIPRNVKKPQKKFTDVRKRTNNSIKQPRQVDDRRDIDFLFEDMSMQDLNNVVEKGDINKIIELKKKKMEQNSQSNQSKNKCPKHGEEVSIGDPNGIVLNPEQIERKAILQALEFERGLQDVRRQRTKFAKIGIKKSMERPVIGSSGYGRFLCSHYNPGTSFINFLNSLSQKLASNRKEKKRIEKEMKKVEDEQKENDEPPAEETKEDNKEEQNSQNKDENVKLMEEIEESIQRK